MYEVALLSFIVSDRSTSSTFDYLDVYSYEHMGIIIIPYRMKIYTEFNFATWLRLVKHTELNI